MLQAKQDTDYFVATFDIQFDLSDWARVEPILFCVVLPHHAHSSKILALSCFSQQIERLNSLVGSIFEELFFIFTNKF